MSVALVVSRPVSRPKPLESTSSTTFPSEIKTPAATSPMFQKREESQKTPLSPPAAYLNFLSKMTSGSALSPPPSASFERPTLTSNPSICSTSSIESSCSEASASTVKSTSSTASTASSSIVSPACHPGPSPVDSAVKRSQEEGTSEANASSHTRPSLTPRYIAHPTTAEKAQAIEIKRRSINVAIPVSPFSPGPSSARSLKRLVIPGSPYSPMPQSIMSPCVATPVVGSPLSAAGAVSPFSMTYSPRDRDGDKIGLRQTITRIISIPSKPAPVMEPVPTCKKRKIEQG